MGIKRLTIRLNPDKVRDKEIISYLETYDRKELRTMNNAVLNAVYEFLKSKNKAHSEKSKTVISDIIPEIRKAISEGLRSIILSVIRIKRNRKMFPILLMPIWTFLEVSNL